MTAISAMNTTAAREDSPSRVIPFSYCLTDEIVVSRSGDYVSTWLIEGLSFEGMSNEDTERALDGLNLLVRGMANGKFAFWVHRIRRRVGDSLSLPPEGYARDLMKRYYGQLDQGGLMATQVYLTILYRPNPQRERGLLGKVARTLGEFQAENASAIEELDNVARQVASSLMDYRPKPLGAYIKNGVKFSDQLTFYGYLVNNRWRPIAQKNIPLWSYLATSRHLFGSEWMETRDQYGSTFGAFVDIKDYADHSAPGNLNMLLGLPCEYIETQSFSPMNVPDAKAALIRQRNQLISSEDNAASQVEEMDKAIDDVISGNFALGEYHYSMQVMADSIDRVRDARAAAIAALQERGFLGVGMDMVLPNAYAAQLPGNWRDRPRVAKLSSRNFAGMSSLHNFNVGKRDGNSWGEAVTILKTPAGQALYFNFHEIDQDRDTFDEKALGNTQIIGASGGGKTVLALFLLFNLLKFGTQIVVFDKDRGCEIAVRAVNGKYLSIEKGKPTGFAPFKMEPTEETMLFWADLIMFCTKIEAAHTAQEEKQIRHAVEAVAQMPRRLRSFGAVLQNLPDVEENSVAARLRKWCASGERPGHFGWCLDCEDDLLQFEDGRVYGFDYTELLEDQRTCPAIMMYLMHRVEQLIDGRRFAFFMDEYWKALSVSYFEDFAKNKQKTIRKQNGFGVYMTQSPSDTLASPIARTLIEQTATFIFLPNDKADRKEYVDGFKLTDAEFETVKSLRKGQRLFAIKQGSNFSLASLDLHGFKDALAVLSGTTPNVARLDRLRAQLGDAPENWLPPFLRGEG